MQFCDSLKADAMPSQDDRKGTKAGVEHEFGGGWTEVKLRAISDYLQFYTTALKEQPKADTPFRLWYVDAFAGTGERTIISEGGGLFSEELASREIIRLKGSARRALEIRPKFHHLAFIEKDPRRFEVLKSVKAEHVDRDIACLNGDANVLLNQLFSNPPWIGRQASLQRAVVFLDPYGMAVKWDTLRGLAATKRIDIWYLFPLHAVLRQLAHDHHAVDEAKRNSLNDLFGTVEWESEFYKSRHSGGDLFGNLFDQKPVRYADAFQVEEFAMKRLNTIFSYVSPPIPILTRRKLRQFSLFCLSGNPNSKAINLIKRGVNAQVKKYGKSI